MGGTVKGVSQLAAARGVGLHAQRERAGGGAFGAPRRDVASRVGLGVDRDSFDAEAVGRAHHAARDLAAVGYQELSEERAGRRHGGSAVFDETFNHQKLVNPKWGLRPHPRLRLLPRMRMRPRRARARAPW